MRWANTRTDTGSLSCSLWAQGVSVPRHWGQPEALLCAQFPPKGQTAFLLGVMFPKVTVRFPKVRCGMSLICLPGDRHQTQERMLPPKSTMARMRHL